MRGSQTELEIEELEARIEALKQYLLEIGVIAGRPLDSEYQGGDALLDIKHIVDAALQKED